MRFSFGLRDERCALSTSIKPRSPRCWVVYQHYYSYPSVRTSRRHKNSNIYFPTASCCLWAYIQSSYLSSSIFKNRFRLFPLRRIFVSVFRSVFCVIIVSGAFSVDTTQFREAIIANGILNASSDFNLFQLCVVSLSFVVSSRIPSIFEKLLSIAPAGWFAFPQSALLHLAALLCVRLMKEARWLALQVHAAGVREALRPFEASIPDHTATNQIKIFIFLHILICPLPAADAKPILEFRFVPFSIASGHQSRLSTRPPPLSWRFRFSGLLSCLGF